MRVELHPGFVLHRHNYRESSLLIEVFSSVHGRAGVVARGALKSRQGTAALLQAFRPLQLSWSGHGDLGTLVRVETDGPALLSGGRAVLSGFYLNELLMRLLHRNDPNPDLYASYRSALEDLGKGGPEDAVVLRIFEKRLLKAIGYGMTLDHDVVTGEAVRPGLDYLYRAEQGPSCRWPELQAEGVQVRGESLLALASEQLADRAVLGELRTLMRHLLRPHLGDRPLVTRAWFTEF